MNNKSKYIYYLAIFAACLLALTYQFILFSKGFYSVSADEALHTIQAYKWYMGDHTLFSMWLPFYKIFLGSIFFVSHDLFLTPRIISCIFGILNILTLIWISHQIFNDRIVDLLTALLSALFAPIIVLSVIPLMGIIYSFFVLLSLGFLIKWMNDQKDINLYSSVFLIAISSMIRYEGWVFSFGIFLIIIYSYLFEKEEMKIKKGKVLIVLLIISVFPLFWIYLSYLNTGSFFGFITQVTDFTRKGYFISKIKNNVFYQFFQINISSLNILGLISIIYLNLSDKKFRKFTVALFLPLILMTLFSFLGKAMPSHNYWRIAAVWCISLIPFTAYWIYSLLKYYPDKKGLGITAFFLTLLLVAFSFVNQTNSMSSHSYLTNAELQAGKYFNSLIKENKVSAYSRILIDNSRWKDGGIIIASQNPEYFILNDTSVPGDKILKFSNKGINVSDLSKLKIKFLVFESNDVKAFLNKSPGLKVLKRFNDWTIYEIN